MEATDNFKTIITNHLQGIAEADPLFAESLKKPAKNISDCVTYILNEVKKSGQNGFADDEIFAMAVHYYDEDTIEIGKPVSGREFLKDGTELHHCVFTNEYYKKPDSLILSARINGTPIETIEVSLSKMEIVQSRGLINKPSGHNKEILQLLKKNMPVIKKTYAGINSIAV